VLDNGRERGREQEEFRQKYVEDEPKMWVKTIQSMPDHHRAWRRLRQHVNKVISLEIFVHERSIFIFYFSHVILSVSRHSGTTPKDSRD